MSTIEIGEQINSCVSTLMLLLYEFHRYFLYRALTEELSRWTFNMKDHVCVAYTYRSLHPQKI